MTDTDQAACGGPAGDRYLPPLCIALRLRFIHVIDMTEPAVYTPGVLGRLGSRLQMCIFQSSVKWLMDLFVTSQVLFYFHYKYTVFLQPSSHGRSIFRYLRFILHVSF